MPIEFEPVWMLAYPIAVIAGILLLALLARVQPGAGRRTAIVLTLVAAAVYISWRVLFTVPTETVASTVIGIALIAAEVLGLTQSALFYVLLWRPFADRPIPLDRLERIPTVDVFIATYNEPVATLRMTVAGAVGMRYPGEVRVHLCDDGDRGAVQELAREFGVGYITRTDHSHAKAGNLNHALTVTDGELFVTLDADMVPRAGFLERTVGRFIDPNLAFVQAPQAFYNEDPFQYNLFSGTRLPNEQDYFMRVLQGAKARFNAVMYVGSNTVFRRSAIDAIGGFATGVITEDMATGMLLHSAGFRGGFVPDVIAAGLAAENLPDLLQQRDRWARGNIQSSKRWNPLLLAGLTPMQRWIYFDGVLYWFFGVFKLVYVVAPLCFLLFGVRVVDAGIAELAAIWLPFFLTSILGFSIISAGRRSFAWSHVYELALAPALAVSAIGEAIGLRVDRFKVTPKGDLHPQRSFHWRIAAPHLAFIALTVAGLLNVFVVNPGQFPGAGVTVVVFWACYNLVGLVLSVLLCIERPRVRTAERVIADVPAWADLEAHGRVAGRIIDISVGGARAVLPWTDGFERERQLEAPPTMRSLHVAGVGEVPGHVRWVTGNDEGLLVGFQFDPLSADQFVAMMHLITELPGWVRDDRERGASVIGSAGRTIVGTTRRARAHARREVRLTTRTVATVVPLTATSSLDALTTRVGVTEAAPAGGRHRDEMSSPHVLVAEGDPSLVHVLDVSHDGCRIRTRHRVEPGALLHVELPNRPSRPEVAEVRWTQRRWGRTEAGLRFIRSEVGVR